MSSLNEPLSTDPRQEFCRSLKAARERRGITLTQIAESTKIPAYLFAALERGDLSRWPKALFRRSFFRDYARTVGLPVAETCDEFVRLFPDEEKTDVVQPGSTPGTTVATASRVSDFRLEFDSTWHGPRTQFLVRLFAALVDAAAIVLVGLAIASAAQLDPPTVVTVVSLVYLILGTVVFDQSPAKYVMSRRAAILSALRHAPAPIVTTGRAVAKATTYLFGSGEGAPPEPVAEPPAREWISDARRVGPEPRFRVRIKVSH